MNSSGVDKKKTIICDCTGTTQVKVEELIKKGRNTVDEIASATGAGTGCGSCDVLIQEVLDQAIILPPNTVDVLCLGYACYDLVFSVDHHPSVDEKMVASNFIECGGGPAANAAVMVAKLGLKSAFSGYLGDDNQGESHYQEFKKYDVDTQLIIRGIAPTPISTVLAKPNGERALVNYKGETKPLPEGTIDFSKTNAKVVLFDGHQPHESIELLKHLTGKETLTLLDAGSVHEGTLLLMDKVDYLVCSEKFAIQYSPSIEKALDVLAELAPAVVITLGKNGLVWRRGQESGRLKAYNVNVVDSTGAGDAFHGAFATALALGKSWLDCLEYASAAGALCCGKMGARLGLPSHADHRALLAETRLF